MPGRRRCLWSVRVLVEVARAQVCLGLRGCAGWVAVCVQVCEASMTTKVWGIIRRVSTTTLGMKSSGRRRFGDLCGRLSVMASRVSCFRETARQGRPRLVRAFIYLSIYLSICRGNGWASGAMWD